MKEKKITTIFTRSNREKKLLVHTMLQQHICNDLHTWHTICVYNIIYCIFICMRIVIIMISAIIIYENLICIKVRAICVILYVCALIYEYDAVQSCTGRERERESKEKEPICSYMYIYRYIWIHVSVKTWYACDISVICGH